MVETDKKLSNIKPDNLGFFYLIFQAFGLNRVQLIYLHNYQAILNLTRLFQLVETFLNALKG